jgi:hypothetical protein
MTSETRRRASSPQHTRADTVEMVAMESGEGGSEDRIPTSSNSESRQPVKVKITLWWLATAGSLLGLATAKAILAYQNNPSANAKRECFRRGTGAGVGIYVSGI